MHAVATCSAISVSIGKAAGNPSSWASATTTRSTESTYRSALARRLIVNASAPGSATGSSPSAGTQSTSSSSVTSTSATRCGRGRSGAAVGLPDEIGPQRCRFAQRDMLARLRAHFDGHPEFRGQFAGLRLGLAFTRRDLAAERPASSGGAAGSPQRVHRSCRLGLLALQIFDRRFVVPQQVFAAHDATGAVVASCTIPSCTCLLAEMPLYAVSFRDIPERVSCHATNTGVVRWISGW